MCNNCAGGLLISGGIVMKVRSFCWIRGLVIAVFVGLMLWGVTLNHVSAATADPTGESQLVSESSISTIEGSEAVAESSASSASSSSGEPAADSNGEVVQDQSKAVVTEGSESQKAPAKAARAAVAPVPEAKAAEEDASKTITVTNEQEVLDAIKRIPTDNSAYKIVLANDMSFTGEVKSIAGQNITFVNQLDPIKLLLTNTFNIVKGSTVNLLGNQIHGITISPTENFNMASVPIRVYGTSSIENTTVTGFSLVTQALNRAPIVVLGGNLTLNNQGYVFANSVIDASGSGGVSFAAGGVLVTYEGTFTMNKGSDVESNYVWPFAEQGVAGGVGVHNSSHFIMNGGLIYNNMSDQAGGVSVGDLVRSTEEAPSTFVMNGGVIEGNLG